MPPNRTIAKFFDELRNTNQALSGDDYGGNAGDEQGFSNGDNYILDKHS